MIINLRTTTYIMIMLLIFQSFSSVVNSLDYHATDSQHTNKYQHAAELHLHDQPRSDVLFIPYLSSYKDNAPNHHQADDQAHSGIDCHHCGHCHSSHAHWLSAATAIKFNMAKINHVFFYVSKVINAPLSQLFRPPKL